MSKPEEAVGRKKQLNVIRRKTKSQKRESILCLVTSVDSRIINHSTRQSWREITDGIKRVERIRNSV